MQDYLHDLYDKLILVFSSQFDKSITIEELTISTCKKEFEGDFTLVLFPWVKSLGKSPDDIGNSIGNALIQTGIIDKYNIIKGFLNMSLNNHFWINKLSEISNQSITSRIKTNKPLKYLVEYCSPNTNKPLHLGHIRNILIGWSVYKILSESGHTVNTTQVINDRGIAICKSMLAWKLYSDGKTPESTGIKSDHFVGDYYVLFEVKFREEYAQWQNSEEGSGSYYNLKKEGEASDDFFKRYKNDYFNTKSSLGIQAKEMLLKWESSDPETLQLWQKMNEWVYNGFEESFKKLDVKFDSYFYESQTYLLGKDIIEEGLKKNVFTKEADNSVWIDLTDVGLDRKIVLRSDGTSVYITQDLGTINLRDKQYHADKYIYVVADEQDYHFKVLTETLKKLQLPYSQGIHHLNYGMVELPSGRMKSREGTVVDADDLIQEVFDVAAKNAEERGELSGLSKNEVSVIIHQIGMSALKYFILKVQAKKRMIFNPEESVDMQGHTGPYIVNAYVRIQSILRRKVSEISEISEINIIDINDSEKSLINSCLEYPDILHEAGNQLDPAHLANYLYQLAKDFHKYYNDYRILNAENIELINIRLNLCKTIGLHLHHGMSCLGIEMPTRM
ncbi:MAG: arginine--tRNA ligase [Saprospiraceae bacterium]|nr:arginine--tRNA ligase [Saprospiraceae bacterium]